jgi:ABC-2 type transport system ATP-binding protein
MKDIRDLITYLSKEKNKTIFLSSHILREVELIATRMIIIDKGTTKVEGNVTDLLNSEKMNVSFEVDDTNKSLKLINESQWQNNYKESLKENIIMEINKEDIPLLNKYFVENGIKVSSVIPTRSLEEFFLKITESSGE